MRNKGDGDASTGKKSTPPYLENTVASTILLVDDHELVRMVTSKILTKEGFHVITAENGKDALDFLQREAIDCVLLDMEMPVMGGLETLQNIRQQGWHQLPVIVMTARAEVENEQRWRTLGFDGFIFKPSAPSELLITVSKFLFHKKPVE
ncbi:MAG: response regulator [Saprospiraceae bacterium]|nr:response regulator [Saprospiraceae bacterium]